MSIRQIINGLEGLNRHQEFFKYSPIRQRVEYYTNKGYYNAHYSYLYADDDKVCLATESRIVRYANGKAWAQSDKDRKGLTYDKHTKKVKFWYNTKMHNFSENEMHTLLDYMDVSWFKDIYSVTIILLTPTMLGKVFSKKITNAQEFCKEFIKTKPWLKNSDITPQKLEEYLTHLTNNRNAPSLGTLIQPLSVAKSGSVLLDVAMKNAYNEHYRFYQMIPLALALDEKIDFSKTLSNPDMDELLIQLENQMTKVKLENYPEVTLHKSGHKLYLVSPEGLVDPQVNQAKVSQEPLLDLVMQDL